MTRSWRIYFGVIALSALALVTFALVARIARDRNAGAPLNLARPIHTTPVTTPERSQPGEILATPDPRLSRPSTNEANQIAQQLNVPPGTADERQYFLDDRPAQSSPKPRIPPEVTRLGEEAVAEYEDLLEANANSEYYRAMAMRDGEPKLALALFRHVEQLTAADSELHAKAKTQEQQQLKDLQPDAQELFRRSDAIGRVETPAAAITRFKEILVITAPDDPLHLAAQAQLDRLRRADLR